MSGFKATKQSTREEGLARHISREHVSANCTLSVHDINTLIVSTSYTEHVQSVPSNNGIQHKLYPTLPHSTTMPSVSSLSDPTAYHILTYGTLLGSNIQNTFLAGPLAFKVLPRPQFSTLQQAIFPPYFAFQTALPIVLALTWPGVKSAALGGATMREHAGPRGLLEEQYMWTALAPIALMCGTSLLNLVLLGPATTNVMKQRKHQGGTKPVVVSMLSSCADSRIHRDARWQEIL